MNLPTEFKLPADKLAELMAVTAWYENMPSFVESMFHAGDRFHENVNEFQMSHLPDHPFFENGFCSHFEIRDGTLCAALDQDPWWDRDEQDPYIYIPFVAEEK